MAEDVPIRRPELTELETFLAAARTGSLARAGHDLHISKTAAAKRLASLEAIAGCRLLDRSTRGVSLTAAGRRLLPRVEQLLAEADRMFEIVGQIRRGEDDLRILGVRSLLGAQTASTERVLSETERLFAEIFHRIDHGIVISRPWDGLILEVNDAFCRLFDYEREELVGHTRDLLGWASPAASEEFRAHLRSTGTIAEFELDGVTKGGTRRRYAVGARLLPLGGEERLVQTVRDITERVKREHGLRAVADLAVSALSSESLDAVFRTGAEIVTDLTPSTLTVIWEIAADGALVPLLQIPEAPKRLSARLPAVEPQALDQLLTDSAVIVEDISDVADLAAAIVSDHGMRSGAIVPITTPTRSFGLLAASSPDPAQFGAADIELMHGIAAIVAATAGRS